MSEIISNTSEADEKAVCMIPAIPRVKSCLLREAIMDMEPAKIEACLSSIHEYKYLDIIETDLKLIEEFLYEFEYDGALSLLSRITEQI